MTVVVAQLTDTHVIGPGHQGELYVDHNDRLRLAVQRLLAESVQPDVVVITGDLTDLGTAEELAIAAELLAPLPMPVLIAPGNHDRRATMREAFDQAWAADDNLSWIRHVGPVSIIGLDTLRTTQVDPDGIVDHRGQFDDRRARWLDHALASTAGRPTVIAMHHPPFRTGIQWMDDSGLEGRELFVEVVERHSNVSRILCGHLHRSITTSVAGVLTSTGLSTIHQVELNLVPQARPQVVCDPPGYELHLLSDGAWVTHTRHFDTGHGVIDPGWA